MLDEAGTLFETIKKKTHPNIYRLANSGRHKGYTMWVATQRPTSIPPTIRDNCLECYCFMLGAQSAAKLVWGDFSEMDFEGKPAWRVIQNLDKLKCLHLVQPNTIKRMAL